VSEPTNILDIRPAIRRKRAAACQHSIVTVDDSAASLTCDDCEAEIDPWWYLRGLARDTERLGEYRREIESGCDAKIAECNVAIAKLNATIERLNAEVQKLVETKNRLWNEQINGRALGSIVAHPRRRARKAAP
jgi:hypothetical protein